MNLLICLCHDPVICMNYRSRIISSKNHFDNSENLTWSGHFTCFLRNRFDWCWHNSLVSHRACDYSAVYLKAKLDVQSWRHSHFCKVSNEGKLAIQFIQLNVDCAQKILYNSRFHNAFLLHSIRMISYSIFNLNFITRYKKYAHCQIRAFSQDLEN